MTNGIEKEKSFLGTDFTTGNITRHLLLFMLPLLLALTSLPTPPLGSESFAASVPSPLR